MPNIFKTGDTPVVSKLFIGYWEADAAEYF